MVLVVCPNLAVDHTLRVERLEPGRVHRSLFTQRQAGGKGVNTARALRALGQEVRVCGFAGGSSGQLIEEGLAEEGIPAELVPTASESRTCLILLSADGQATVVNEPGPRVSEADALRDRLERLLPQSAAVAFMGSLPPGVPADLYSNLVRRCRELGLPSLVDTSGEALRAALESRPTYAKPNQEEAEALLGRPLETEEALLRAAQDLCAMGAEVALITLGARGAVAASSGTRARLTLPRLKAVNPIGAGDALAAGLLAGHLQTNSLREVVRLGMAAGAASTLHGFGRIHADEVRPEAVSWIEL